MKHSLASRRMALVAGLIAIAGSLAPSAFGQLNSSAASVTLNATLAESLTVSVSPNNVTFTLGSNSFAAASDIIVIDTVWSLSTARSNVSLYSFFASANAALTDGAPTPDNIPSSDVSANTPDGIPTTWTPYTQTIQGIGGAGAALQLFSQPLSAGSFSGHRSDGMGLQIFLPPAGAGLSMPAATYTGTLTFLAQAS